MMNLIAKRSINNERTSAPPSARNLISAREKHVWKIAKMTARMILINAIDIVRNQREATNLKAPPHARNGFRRD